MAYTGKTNWVTGDKVGSADMNRIETALTSAVGKPNVASPSGGVFGSAYSVALDPTQEQWVVGTLGSATPLTITASGGGPGSVLRIFGTQAATPTTLTIYDGANHANDATVAIPALAGAIFNATIITTANSGFIVALDSDAPPAGDLAGSGSTWSAPVVGDLAITPRKMSDSARGGWGRGITETMPQKNCPPLTVTLTPTAGTLYLFGGCVVPAGRTVNTVTVLAGGAGPVTPTDTWFCLVDRTTLNIVAITANQVSSSWGANVWKAINLTAGYTPSPNATEVYVGVLQSVTTQVLRTHTAHSANNTFQGLTPYIAATALTGLTTPPSVGTSVGTLTGLGQNVPCVLT